MSLKFREAFKQTVLSNKCCTHQIHTVRKQRYLSYRFSQKNGYSETSFTSVDRRCPPRGSHSNSSKSSSEHAQVNNVVVKALRKTSAHDAEIGKLYEHIHLDKVEECTETVFMCKTHELDPFKEINQNHKEFVGLNDRIDANKDETTPQS